MKTYLDTNGCEVELLRKLDWERRHDEVVTNEEASFDVQCGALSTLRADVTCLLARKRARRVVRK